MPIIDPLLDAYCHDRTVAEPEPLRVIARDTAKLPGGGMLCGRIEGRLLKLLAGLVRARRVLEIGTFTGYSALSLAEALAEDGRVVTCELDARHAEIARRNFATSPHGRKVELREGPALATIATLAAPFDLVFIDADKDSYPAYWRAAAELVPIGGLVVVDNALWHGDVVDPQDRSGRAIDETNRLIAADPRFDNVLLTVRDGVHIARRGA